jgi:hypothetical protein
VVFEVSCCDLFVTDVAGSSVLVSKLVHVQDGTIFELDATNLTLESLKFFMFHSLVPFQCCIYGEPLETNVALECVWIGMENQMIFEVTFSNKFVDTHVTLESFLMNLLMIFEESLRLECLVAGSTLEDFSCHVFLHVSHQLIFALEQETAVIAP